MKSISAVIITLNEEENIKACLESVTFADELVVVDTGSTDKTLEIAKKYTNKVFTHPKVTHVEPVRKFAVAKATKDRVLLLDADERIPVTLAEKLQELASTDTEVYRIPRNNIIFGKALGHTGWWPDYNVRFFKKDAVEWLDGIHSQPKITGKEENLPAEDELAIIHQNYQSVSHYLTKMLHYTTVQAKEVSGKEEVSWRDFIRKPTGEFLMRYFALEGYKDGLHGLVLSLLQAFSEFIVVCKVWEIQDYKPDAAPGLKELYGEYRNAQKETEYWFHHTRVKEEKNPLKKAQLKVFKRKI